MFQSRSNDMWKEMFEIQVGADGRTSERFARAAQRIIRTYAYPTGGGAHIVTPVRSRALAAAPSDTFPYQPIQTPYDDRARRQDWNSNSGSNYGSNSGSNYGSGSTNYGSSQTNYGGSSYGGGGCCTCSRGATGAPGQPGIDAPDGLPGIEATINGIYAISMYRPSRRHWSTRTSGW